MIVYKNLGINVDSICTYAMVLNGQNVLFISYADMCVFASSSVRIPLVQLQKVVADVTQILSLTFGTMHRLVIRMYYCV